MNEKLQEALKLLQSGVAFSTPGVKREQNTKIIKEALNKTPEVVAMRESMKNRYGIDVTDAKAFPVNDWSFSWPKMRESIQKKLKEADDTGAFVQFLRAGIQNITSAAYETVSTTYEDWVTVVQSGRDTELYTPNHGVAFPREVGAQMHYPEVGAAALDIKLKNRKFGSMYVVTKELIEDDQTGSFQRQAAMLGEYLKLLCEIMCYGKLAGNVAGLQYMDYSIPLSETKPTSEAVYPWSTALVGGGKNRPAAFGAMTQANIQEAVIALMQQKNLQGIRMQVAPDRFLIGPKLSFDLSVLVHSSYYPSGAATAGSVGGAFAINPIKSIGDITVTRYMPNNTGSFDDSKAWYMIDSKKPWFVLQLREPISVVQENPMSGESFERDVYRFKASARKNADHLDPRFAWQGNDGSV